MSEPTYSVSIKANCGCRWSKVTVITNALSAQLLGAFSDTASACLQHAATTSHVIDGTMLIRPIGVEKAKA